MTSNVRMVCKSGRWEAEALGLVGYGARPADALASLYVVIRATYFGMTLSVGANGQVFLK